MVMEYMPHDLSNFMQHLGRNFRTAEVKCLFRQVCVRACVCVSVCVNVCVNVLIQFTKCYSYICLKSSLTQRPSSYFLISKRISKRIQILDATAYMHSRWFLHRDLKTSNILMNNEGTLSVCDFGLARKVR